jgi:hypothetical protein
MATPIRATADQERHGRRFSFHIPIETVQLRPTCMPFPASSLLTTTLNRFKPMLFARSPASSPGEWRVLSGRAKTSGSVPRARLGEACPGREKPHGTNRSARVSRLSGNLCTDPRSFCEILEKT